MTYVPGLSPCTYFDRRGMAWGRYLTAIGWLDGSHDFPRGTTAGAVINRVLDLVEEGFEPVTLLGFFSCELCLNAPVRTPTQVDVGRHRVGVGCANLFVPARDTVYVAPSMILHYIVVHQYNPPAAFREAVLAGPPPGSPEYRGALSRRGPRDWRQVDRAEPPGALARLIRRLHGHQP